MKGIKAALILALLVGLVGCASSGRKIDQSAADKIEKGKSTQAEVISLIGSPDNIIRRAGGETIFSYSYVRASAKPASFIPLFGPLVGGANVQHQIFMVVFDSRGVVKDYMSSQGASESGMGAAAGGKVDLPEVEQGKRPK